MLMHLLMFSLWKNQSVNSKCSRINTRQIAFVLTPVESSPEGENTVSYFVVEIYYHFVGDMSRGFLKFFGKLYSEAVTLPYGGEL